MGLTPCPSPSAVGEGGLRRLSLFFAQRARPEGIELGDISDIDTDGAFCFAGDMRLWPDASTIKGVIH
jgi:hypothetical protein